MKSDVGSVSVLSDSIHLSGMHIGWMQAEAVRLLVILADIHMRAEQPSTALPYALSAVQHATQLRLDVMVSAAIALLLLYCIKLAKQSKAKQVGICSQFLLGRLSSWHLGTRHLVAGSFINKKKKENEDAVSGSPVWGDHHPHRQGQTGGPAGSFKMSDYWGSCKP